jgi:hypothetical protein
MDEMATRIREQLRAIEARHRKAGKRLERMQADHDEQGEAIGALHQALADGVAEHGCAAGMSPDVVANITGPKVPPGDD